MQAVAGDAASSRLAGWLNQNSKVQCDVVTVPEEASTASALRSLQSKIKSDTFVVLSGDLVSELQLKPIVAAHQLSKSLCTVLLSQRRSSPSAETKPGKAPKAVDYIGLDAKKERLLFHASSSETIRDLKVSMNVIRKFGSVNISSDLADVHVYVFSKTIFPVLESKPQLTNLKLDVLPYLASQQLKLAAQAEAPGTDDDHDDAARQQHDHPLPGLNYLTLSSSSAAAAPSSSSSSSSSPSGVGVYIVHDKYCARMNSIQSYGDINRDVSSLQGCSSSVACQDACMHATCHGGCWHACPSAWHTLPPPTHLLVKWTDDASAACQDLCSSV
jgi:translation initiation factor eIF-2B subunit gamma